MKAVSPERRAFNTLNPTNEACGGLWRGSGAIGERYMGNEFSFLDRQVKTTGGTGAFLGQVSERFVIGNPRPERMGLICPEKPCAGQLQFHLRRADFGQRQIEVNGLVGTDITKKLQCDVKIDTRTP